VVGIEFFLWRVWICRQPQKFQTDRSGNVTRTAGQTLRLTKMFCVMGRSLRVKSGFVGKMQYVKRKGVKLI
jgi:hypothetical protein